MFWQFSKERLEHLDFLTGGVLRQFCHQRVLRTMWGDPWDRDLHDLLRQQSENLFSRSKIWWIMRFSAVFLDFHIFQNFNGFGMFWAFILISWRDLLSSDGPKSIWHRLLSICSIWRPGNLSYSWSSWILWSLFKAIPDLRLRHQRAIICISNILIWYHKLFSKHGEQKQRNQIFIIFHQIWETSLFSRHP